MKFESRWTQAIFLLLLTYLFFTLSRVFLFAYSSDIFSNLTPNELTSMLLLGVYIDSSIIFRFFSIAFILLVLPLSFVYIKRFRLLIGLYWASVVIFMLAVNLADIIYFADNAEHINSTSLEEYLTLFTSHIVSTLFFSLLFISLFFYILRIFSAEIEQKEQSSKEWLLIFAFLGVSYVAISEYFHVEQKDTLALNGFYNYYKNSTDKTARQSELEFRPSLQKVQELIDSEKCKAMGMYYPLFRYYAGHTQLESSKKPNVVVVVTSELNDIKNMGDLYRKGVNFTHFHTNSQDPYKELVALLFATISLDSKELELHKLSSLAHLANKNSYNTLFISDSKKAYVKQIAEKANFHEVYIDEQAISKKLRDALNVKDHSLLSFLFSENSGEKELYSLVKSLKSQKYFDETIFIFTALHSKADDENRVPFLMYAPKYFKAAKKEYLVSQVDFLPSMMDVLRFNSGFTSISNSLFDKSVKSRFVVSKFSDTISFIQGSTILDYKNDRYFIREGNFSKESEYKEKLSSILKVQSELLKNSTWSKR